MFTHKTNCQPQTLVSSKTLQSIMCLKKKKIKMLGKALHDQKNLESILGLKVSEAWENML